MSEPVVVNDFRAVRVDVGGFIMVKLEDTDDGDVIILDEDKILALTAYLRLISAEIECPNP